LSRSGFSLDILTSQGFCMREFSFWQFPLSAVRFFRDFNPAQSLFL